MKVRAVLVLVVASLASLSVRAEPSDHEALAKRFRPYYKFSVEPLHGQEKVRPISWQSFVHQSELWLGAGRFKTNDQMQGDGSQILGVENVIFGKDTGVNSDLTKSHLNTHPFSLHIAERARAGDSWHSVIHQGAGLYALVEEVDDFVVLTYWTLFAYNSGTGGPAFDHDGDLAAVSVVYDRTRDSIVRANFVMHGAVLEQYDLQAPATRGVATLTGLDGDEKTSTSVNTQVLNIAPDRRYQDGPGWHSPSRPSDVYFAVDPGTGKFEHLVVFVEWGTHEGWPNPHGSVMAAPQHNGNGVSFLPDRVRFLGSIEMPNKDEAPFLLFNGAWGDPPGPLFHPISLHTNASDAFVAIPGNALTDRDPYSGKTMSWPPKRVVNVTQARVTISSTGNRSDAQVAMRWGHPDFNDTAYFATWTVKPGQPQTKTFPLPDQKSEFEIQTEGGTGTTYVVVVEVDSGNGFPAQPSIVLKHQGSGADAMTVPGDVHANRSSGPNKYGEQNVRVVLP